MTTLATDPTTSAPPRKHRAKGGRRDVLAVLAMGFLLLLVIFAVFGQQIAPEANDQSLRERLTPPAWSDGGSWEFPLGTDALGRDVLERLVVGTRTTLLIGFVAAAIEVVIGATLGLIAGFRGGRLDSLLMRWADIQMGFPTLLLILLFLLTFGSNTPVLILALGVNGWMIFGRLMRSEARRIRNEPFIQAARVAGMPDRRILVRHVLPQVRSRLVAVYFLEVPRVILAASGLSFLGLGVSADQVTWGLMIGDARSIISVAYWPSFFPGLAIVLTVASLYIFASWFEPRIDPIQRRAQQAKRPKAVTPSSPASSVSLPPSPDSGPTSQEKGSPT